MEKDSFLEELWDMIRSGKIDRRDFLKLAGAAGLTGIGGKTFAQMRKGKSCVECHSTAPTEFVVDPATQQLIAHAHAQGIDLVWDRGAPCEFSHKGLGGVSGVCCFRCQMGPCTLGGATGKKRGGCGATADIIVARNLVRRVAGGASAHIEHARAVAKVLKGVGLGTLKYYRVSDKRKLDAIYKGLGCTGANKALAVANKSLDDLNKDDGVPAWLEYKALNKRKKTWKKTGILPTGGSPEVTQAEHRTTMGVDGDMPHLASDALKLGLVDGYCGLHIATGLQDILFGTPKLAIAEAGLTVIRPDKINIVVHGHEPILSEKIVDAAENFPHPPKPINVVGMCCTGNEVLMRRGVNVAGSMVQQELAIATGAVEAMVVDVQCVIPNIQRVASRFHTRVITTNPQAKITGATHMEFEPEKADEIAKKIVTVAVNNYKNRDKQKVFIPSASPKPIMAGFSADQIIDALKALNPADPLKPLIDNIVSNNIRGIVGIVGCVTPRDKFGYRHIAITEELIANDILVVGTGCWAHVAAQRGLLSPDPDYPKVGAGLKAVLKAVAKANGLKALPPCWHMGSCVDNSRIEDVLNPVAAYLKVDIPQLPVAASAPEFITEKAVAIGTWAVDLGLFTHIGGQPYVSGSKNVVKLLTQDVEGLTGGKFFVETDAKKAAMKLIQVINQKRKSLGLKV